MITTYTSYAFLLLSVFSLWLPLREKDFWWRCFLFLGICLSVLLQQMTCSGAGLLFFFYFLIKKYRSAAALQKNIFWLAALFLGYAVMIGWFSCFSRLPILTNVRFTPDAIPFNLSFCFSGVALGIIIIGETLPRAIFFEEWKGILQATLMRMPVVIAAFLVSSLILGFVKWEPKIPQHLFVWMLSNLFFTCIAEEGFFRGFFQEFLMQQTLLPRGISIFVPTVFFGLAHYRGGAAYVLLAALAGIFYGWIYARTRRVEASMLMHFLLNLVHLLFFTYPALGHGN